MAQASRSPGEPRQSVAEGLAGRPELLLGDRSGRVFHRRAVCRRNALGVAASRSVRARCASVSEREQVMTFLGRKYRETFQGEVRTHWRQREPGAAVKHWVKSNAIKMYDKDGSRLADRDGDQRPTRVLRASTSTQEWDGTTEVGWFPMNKGVANLYRYAEVSQRARTRLSGGACGRQRPGRRPEGI